MPAKIRLQRHGKKGQPFYHIVVADSRSPRDGRFIEKLGTYNPLTNPAQINIKFERALYWYSVGAQPTDTARSLLSKTGVMMKYHLMRGVQKGAMTEEQAEVKFQNWMKEKEARNANIVKANEVPRIAQQFGLDSSVKVNMTSVIHATTTAVNLTRSVARAAS